MGWKLLIVDDDEAIHAHTRLILAIDDFGAGYSSLAYLKQRAIDQLKVYRSFINDMTDKGGNALIAESIIRRSHALNLSVIAKGIEIKEHEIILRDLVCHEAQGYLYSRLLTKSESLSFVKVQQS